VHGDGERHERIERQPTGEIDQRHAGDDSGRGPDVGHQVLAIGLERDAVVLAPLADQDQRDREVDGRGDDGEAEAGERHVERPGRHEARERGPDDAAGGYDDERSFYTGGKVFRLREAVGVIRIGRRRGEAKHRERKQRRREVDERLERIGQQPDGPGQPPGRGLERNRGDGGCNRQPGKALKLHRRDAS